MIILDKALEKRSLEGNPVKAAVIGAGYMGRGMVFQMLRCTPGILPAAVYSRNPVDAVRAYVQAGYSDAVLARTPAQVEKALAGNRCCVVQDPELICQAPGIEVIIEATGQIDFGARICLEAISQGKHVVLMNAELDGTLGPLLKTRADSAGVVLTNVDGDQPGVLMNLLRWVRTIGCKPVLAGNVKGLHDPYRTPATQKAFADRYRQKPAMVTSFADGTKVSFEMAVVANATGFKTGQRGMYGPRCGHVSRAAEHFRLEEMLDRGLVDYLLGAEPPGVFVLGYNDQPVMKQYMDYYKMGPGPVYVFYIPYHLPSVEAPLTAARAALFQDAAIAPLAGPVCHVMTAAKRNMKAGHMLDGIGGFDCYGLLENACVVMEENLLPMGLARGSVLTRDVRRDEPLGFGDVSLPAGSLGWKLWQEQAEMFPLLEPEQEMALKSA